MRKSPKLSKTTQKSPQLEIEEAKNRAPGAEKIKQLVQRYGINL